MALPVILYPMTPLSSFSGLLVPEFAKDISASNRKRMSRVASEALGTTLLYSSVCAVVLYSFSEELGYTVYGSYEAGYYIRTLAPVVPIMYLDHVTDSMLKGIGEQVFSMWVNISDSLLSILLVWFLIPKMGILGYAVVIVVMEGYNFALSFFRLKKKINFKVDIIRTLALPLLAALASASVTNVLFKFSGRYVPPVWLAVKILFALCVTAFILALVTKKPNAVT
jgi:stage V sporulation protein B